MRKYMRFICLFLCMCLLFGVSGCGNGDRHKESEKSTLRIAYQYGLAYVPLVVCKEQKQIEKAYKEKTGKDIVIEWNQMNSGADINTAFASGEMDAGFVGVAPAITGISKKIGYKIFTNLSGQEHGLMTNKKTIHSIEELIHTKDQIALVNMGSIQHIILAKALAQAGLDPHALDASIVAMKHPDGMLALENKSVVCHLTTNPYLYLERNQRELYEIQEISSVWPVENSFIVGVALEELENENRDLYEALCKGISESIDFVNNEPEKTAELTYSYDGNTKERELEYIKKGVYTTETRGVFQLAKFMWESQFIDSIPEKFGDLVFDNVCGD